MGVFLFSRLLIIGACLSLQETTFLDRAASLQTNRPLMAVVVGLDMVTWSVTVSTLGLTMAIAGVGRDRRKMRNVFRKWVFGSNGRHTHVGGFSSFAEGIIARVEVFPFLELDRY